MNYEAYLPYAATEYQKDVLKACIKHGTQKKAAKHFGVNERNIRKTLKRVKDRAAVQGYSPAHDMVHPAPDTHIVKGVSTLYNEEGQVKSQWVKTDLAKEAQKNLMEGIAEALKNELPVLPMTPYYECHDNDLMAVYPLGDPHIGMAAIKEEAGQDWDLKTAEIVFLGIFDRLVKSAPNCERAVIVNLGDYFHADNVAGVTTRSGHHLDMDGNYMSMVEVGVKIMVQMINSALEVHKHVEVVTAIGNHDDTGAMFLQVALKHMYQDEPRVTIHCSPAPFQYVRHGKCFFGVHHGHTTKSDKLPLVMATDRAQDWGETEFRYWYTGHIHHDTLKEYAGVTVESFRTAAAKDAYASWGGYRSGQDSKAIVLHKEFGEVERHTINIAQLRNTHDPSITGL